MSSVLLSSNRWRLYKNRSRSGRGIDAIMGSIIGDKIL